MPNVPSAARFVLKRMAASMMGLVWAAAGGGGAALVDVLDGAVNYEGPIDWQHVKKLALIGAALGVVGWVRQQKALYTLPPGVGMAQTKKEE